MSGYFQGAWGWWGAWSVLHLTGRTPYDWKEVKIPATNESRSQLRLCCPPTTPVMCQKTHEKICNGWNNQEKKQPPKPDHNPNPILSYSIYMTWHAQ